MKMRKPRIWTLFGTVLLLLILTALMVSGIIMICNRAKEKELDQIQSEALAELLEREGEYDEHSIVLQNTTHSEAEQLAERFGAKLRITKDGRFATLTLPETVTIKDIYAHRENREYIEAMSPDFLAKTSDLTEEEEDRLPLPARPQYTVNDAGFASQTYLDYLNIGATWSTTRGVDITVAVIDTGIDTDHPEFAGKISEYSYNATEDKIVKDYTTDEGGYDWSLIEDGQGHGTGVSGVIAASMNNGEGVVGVAPEVTLLVIKVECDANGSFYRTSDLVFGLYYAIERDVNVVNMSFGSYDSQNPFASATRLAVDSDVICMAAAGNDATTALSYPAADENVISVGAMANGSWELAPYSNYGENVNIVAPGTTYTTKMGGTYGTMNGTSLACPTAVGAVALYLSQNRYATFEGVTENLYAACVDLGDLGKDWYYGYGALDIYALVCEERGKITFNMLTDELDNTEQLFVRNHTLQNIPEPERTYAVFDGWYYDIDCTEPLNLYADEFSSDLTLYASWVNEDDGVPYTYVELDDGTIEIRSYTGKRRYITVPDTIDGKAVSSIGDFAFQSQGRLRTVDLPKGLKQIGLSAFENCNNLVSIAIPDGVTEIGTNAFARCVRLSSVAFGAKSALKTVGSGAFSYCGNLKRIELPTGVTSIGGSAFLGDTSLTAITVRGGNPSFASVDGVLFNHTKSMIVAYPAGLRGEYTIPTGVTTIGDCAFAYTRLKALDLTGVQSLGSNSFYFSMLEGIVIPDTVISLGKESFAYSFYLKSVTLSTQLSSISKGAFFGCSMLNNVVIPANVKSIGETAFSETAALSGVTFAEGSRLTQIGGSAFAESGLKEIALPASLISVGSRAFGNDIALSSVTFAKGSNLQLIGSEAFTNTPSLTAITLPTHLREIGDYAFQESGLTSVTLPASLSYLGVGAFASCHSLENIFVDDANTNYIDLDGVVYNPSKTVILAYPAGNARNSYTVEPTVTEIGNAAFYGSHKLTSVSLPNGLITVGEYGFYDCRSITGYSLPSSLTYIEAYAFAYNSNLGYSIDIPDAVYQISNYAFAYDYNLHYIYFSANATLPRISYAAFACTGLYDFTVPASVSTVAQDAFIGCPSLQTVTFAAGSKLESISAYMFKGCEALTSITFENGSKLTSIEAHGFEGMTNLQSVNFGDAKLTNIDNYAFRYCESLTTLPIPDGTDYIGRYAFYGCKALERLNIPASIDYIGENAFYFAENLNLYFAAERLPADLVENWDSGIRGYYVGVQNVIDEGDWSYAVLGSGKISIIEYRGNATALDLTALKLGGDIVSIGGYAFNGTKLESITLPTTLGEIHRYAFAFSKIKNISIPDSVTFIGQYAFLTTPIEAVTFGAASQIQNIEQYAFAYCDHLASFKIPASLETLGRYTFTESGLTSVDFSEATLTKLSEGAFMGTKLTNVILPDSLTLINHNAFRDCESLASVTFGKGEMQLMSNVFYNTGITDITIPDNLTYIGEYSLVGLKNLTEFKVSATHPKYTVVDGLLYSKDGRKLIAAPAGKTGEITLPKDLEVLGFGAFENSKLSKINFHPDSNILTFGYRCFYNAAIVELNVPESVVSFDFYAFAMCQNLTTVTFAEDNNLRGIYEGAFYGCTNLRNIVIPESIVEISDYAFYGCASLESLPFSESAEIMGIYDYAFAYTDFETVTLPETLFDLGNYAFRGAKLKSITIPDANKEQLILGIGAFADCNQMEEITLPFIGASFEDYDITWLGYIFGAGGYEANNAYVPQTLKKVTIADGISFIGTGGFYGLTGLEKIQVPHSVSAVYKYSFLNTAATYELTNMITLYRSDVSGNRVINTSADANSFGVGLAGRLELAPGVTEVSFSGVVALTGIKLPEGVTAIADSAFEGCSDLTDVSLPASVTEIGDYAFFACGALTSIEIPAAVQSIGASAFEGCDQLKGVTFAKESQLTGIGDSAFSGCHALHNIEIPAGVTALNFEVFADCTALTAVTFSESSRLTQVASQVFYGCSSLTSIQLPVGVTSIGYGMFYGCQSLQSIQIPAGVTGIYGSAFDGCTGLTSVTIPAEVTVIGDYAFQNCTSLTSIELPENLSEIGTSAFFACNSLYQVINHSGALTLTLGSEENGAIAYYARAVTNADGGKQFKDDQNFVYIDTAEGFRFSYYNGSYQLISYLGKAETVTLPANINGYAYSLHKVKGNLCHVIIPEGVTQIGDDAFYDCKTLQSIEIPASVTYIGDNAFYGCAELESVTFATGSQLTSIGSSAFANCTALTTIEIPAGVTSTGFGSFWGCERLTDVTFAAGSLLESIDSSAFSRCTALRSISIPAGVTNIGNYAFSGCHALARIKLSEKVESIGRGAFADSGIQALEIDANNPYFSFQNGVLYDKTQTSILCVLDSVTEVIIPATVTNIANAFSGCADLKRVTFAEGSQLTSIGDNAFSDCVALTDIELPASVTDIGGYAFSGCASLASIKIPAGVTGIGDYAFSGCALLTEIKIPAGVTSIGFSTLAGCRALTSIEIPSGVTSIGDYAFSGCSGLTEISLPAGVTSIGNSAFSGCDALIAIEIPAGVTSIGDYAFSECRALVSITLPASITKIGNYAFYGCSGLVGAELLANVTSIGDYTFSGCVALTSIKIPAGVVSIGAHAFAECVALVSVDIPVSVMSIGDSAFSGCSSLQAVKIPVGVTDIGAFAFFGCSSLTAIEIPAGMTRIEDWTFSDCGALTSVILPASISDIGGYAFSGCGALLRVELPVNMTNIGECAFSGCGSLTSITLPAGITGIGAAAFSDCESLYEVINNSTTLTLTLGGAENGAVAYYARVLVNADGSKQWKDDQSFVYVDTAEGFRFSYYNGAYRLIAYLGDAAVVTLPTDINGNPYSIDRIKGNLRHVIIPSGVTSIGNDAFYGCSGLTGIEIPASVESIGDYAFYGCNRLTDVTFAKDSQLSDIGEYAFSWCSSLTNIDLPTGVKKIGASAFSGCNALAGIELPTGVTVIGASVFDHTAYYNDPANWENGCLLIGKHLIDVKWDAVVAHTKGGAIAEDAFDACTMLRSVIIGGIYDGVLSPLQNLETLILTDTSIGCIDLYFGGSAGIPATLKSIVLTAGCDITGTSLLAGITDVVIYVEDFQKDVQWSQKYPAWNNDNRVYYGGDWIKAEFCDANGNILSSEYYTTSQVIRQPILDNITDGEYLRVFAGWDLNGDGVVDFVPATSASDIRATAVFETHRPGAWIEQTPTCTEDGYRQQICLDCGEVVNYKHLSKLGHTSAGLVQAVLPTCTEDGYEIHTCTTCKGDYHTKFVSATGHSFGDWITKTEATCTETGSRYHICTICTHREDEVIPATGHTYEAKVTKEATCTEQGSITYTCIHCGNVAVEATATAHHNYKKTEADQAVMQWLTEHLYNAFLSYEGEWGYYFKCTECSRIQTCEVTIFHGASAENSTCRHQLTNWTVSLHSSCLNEGVEMRHCALCNKGVEARIYELAQGHDFAVDQHDATHHWQKCSRCDEIDGKAEHTGGTATCTDQKVCADCGIPYGDTLGHDFTVDRHDETHHWQKCSRCDEIDGKAEHRGGTATCTEQKVCTDCGTKYGELLQHNFNIPQKDTTHHWNKCANCDAINTKVAHSGTDDGDCTTAIICSCGHILTEAKASHTGGTATCTDQKTCTECGTKYGEALGHDFAIEPYDETYHRQKCSRCDESDGKAEHRGGTATCTEQKVCTDCGTKYGELLQHIFNVPQKDDTHHWNKCANCDVIDTKILHSGTDDGDCTTAVVCACGHILTEAKASHTGGTATCTEQKSCTECGTKYGEALGHDFAIEPYDETYHRQKCSRCDESDGKAEHRGGTATCTEQKICTDCGTKYGELLQHNFNVAQKDDTHHWNKCANCDAINTKVAHSGTDDGDCTTAIICSCGHILTEAKASHTGGTATCTDQKTCTECGTKYGEALGHDFAIEPYDETYHRQKCSRCEESDGKAEHRGGTATCTDQKICTDCGTKYGELLQHNFNIPQKDTTHHWNKCANCDAINTKVAHSGTDDGDCTTAIICSCGHILTEAKASHTGGTATCTDQKVCTDCGTPYGDTLGHDFTVDRHDETHHWQKCSRCDEIDGKAEHRGGTATCTDQKICTDCGTKYGELLQHNFNVPQKDDTHHWNKCANCDAINTKVAHSGTDDGDCTTAIICSCGHILTEAKASHTGGTATCTDQKTCTECGTKYGEALGHDFAIEPYDETYHRQKCSRCDESDGKAEHRGGTATCTEQKICTDCGTKYGELLHHIFNVAQKDDTHHWNKCANCDAINTKVAHSGTDDGDCTTAVKCACGHILTEAKANHTGGTATCTEPKACTECGTKYGEALDHDFSVDQHDTTHHWQKCSRCEEIDGKEVHTGGTATCTDQKICTDCGNPYGETLGHNFTIDLHDTTHHWQKCSRCEEIDSKTEHRGGTATCTAQKICADCGTRYGELLHHIFNVAQKDDTHHWNKCESCDAINTKVAHSGTDDGDCTTAVICSCGHILTEAKASHTGGTATCTEQKACTECGTKYGELLQHIFNVPQKDDTHHWNKCKSCNATDTKISHIKTDDGDCTTAVICTCGYVLVEEMPSHTGGTATCTEPKVCTECGIQYDEVLGHDFTISQNDDVHHWQKCSRCEEINGKIMHHNGEDHICDVCGYESLKDPEEPEAPEEPEVPSRKGLSTGAIVGIAGGCTVAVGGIAVLVWFVIKKKIYL